MPQDAGFILIRRNTHSGITFGPKFHLYLQISSPRDDSQPEISSLFAGFPSQG